MYLPDDNRGYFDRISVRVIDLHRRGFLVSNPYRNRPADRERVHPTQSCGADAASIASEQLNDPGLSRLDSGEPGSPNGRQYKQGDPEAHSDGTVADDQDANDHSGNGEYQNRNAGPRGVAPLLYQCGRLTRPTDRLCRCVHVIAFLCLRPTTIALSK